MERFFEKLTDEQARELLAKHTDDPGRIEARERMANKRYRLRDILIPPPTHQRVKQIDPPLRPRMKP